MSNDLTSLDEKHVRQIGEIIEALERSNFDFLQFEVGDLKVTIGKGNVTLPGGVSAPAVNAPTALTPPPAAASTAPVPKATAEIPAATPRPSSPGSAATPGSLEIKSPIMGMFYAQPEPGAPPFVTVGATVDEGTTVGLVEVMKTFNAVSAGVNGKIVEVCARNGELVEFGQVLFRVAAN